MSTLTVPYGRGHLSFTLPDGLEAEVVGSALPLTGRSASGVVTPRHTPAAPDPAATVEAALDAPVGGVDLAQFRGIRSASIAVNDKTRPVPHQHLLPPLLRRLEGLGLSPEAIRLIIATGTHAVMPPEEYSRVVPQEVLDRHPVLCHDTDDQKNLVHLGTTSRGTPVWINQHFVEADLRIVVGNIEPHQIQGFSGGVKSAAVGLAGRDTINHNHAMMTDPRATLGRYADNPARQDLEEIGDLMPIPSRRDGIGVHFALNAILNGKKEIVHVIAGQPRAVMEKGIPLSREISQVAVAAPFDLVIASPGGHPKDINFYQSQKALAHAAGVTREGGTVILTAACPEGIGSPSYEAWMEGIHTYEEVFARFEREGFRVGPHKALLIARDAAHRHVFLISEMAPDVVRGLLLSPATSIDEALATAVSDLPADARVGILPRASSTIPYVGGQR